ncbi:MAG: aminotransferase class V-fold PLP-dependent enzyme [Patescibacteria group bacterium]|mgnify:CR=1 FL=1
MSNNIKTKFPIFKHQTNLVYLDNAATTQICALSLDAMNEYYLSYRANVHRGLYDISEKATSAYENARAAMAKFINADKDEIIFNSGVTFGINELAYSLSPRLTHRDNIVLTRMEHHANLVPWQVIAKHYGFEIRFIELTKDFQIDIESAKKLINKNTKIVSFALVSNVLGTIAPVAELIKLAKAVRATTIVDAAQAAAHLPIDVKKIGCDFLVFSGHKMYGPSGIGILYGKKKLLEEFIEPFFYGGEMIGEVSYDKATWNEVPARFEAGTPNIAGAIGLGAAAKFIMDLGWDKILKHEASLTKYAIEKLALFVKIFGPNYCHSERSEESLAHWPSLVSQRSFATAQDDNCRIGVISFSLPGIHPHDIAEIFNRDHIAIRAGYHCAEPLHKLYNLPGSARISIGIYNSEADIDRAVAALKKATDIFSII